MTKTPVDLTNPEDSVVGVRWIVLSNPGRKVLVNEYIDRDSIEDLTSNHEATISFRAKIERHYADFFMIANEFSAWGLGSYAVGSIVFPETLKEKILNYSTYLQVNTSNLIPMAGIYEHLYIAADGKTYKNGDNTTGVLQDPGEIERLYAKVTFKLTALASKQSNDGDSIDIEKIAIKRMPTSSYLAPYLYLGTTTFDGADIPVSPGANYVNSFAVTDSLFRGMFSFYIPEYLVSDTAKYTYASVGVRLRSDADAKREYRIVIGNGITTFKNDSLLKPTSPGRSYTTLSINRNTHYYFDASIINFDLRGEQEIEIRPRILDWGVTPVDSAYIRDYYLTVGQDKFVVPPSASSFYGVIRVTTDYTDGWSAVVTPSGAYTTVTAPATFPVPTGDLRFTYNGTLFVAPSHPADTISITAGALTKKIIITNP
jgi:hypothetical protein